jgi:hypothetical protein
MSLTLGRNLILALFLIISGLAMCGVGLPRWLLLLGGICGIVAGVLLLVGGS